MEVTEGLGRMQHMELRATETKSAALGYWIWKTEKR